MPIVVECDPRSPLLIFPDCIPDCRAESFYEDKKRIYSRSLRLPASVGRVEEGQIIVTQRTIFIGWARSLRRLSRILILGELPEQVAVQVRVLSKQELLNEEEEDFTTPAWQIYRFERSLTVRERDDFTNLFQEACGRADRVELVQSPTFFDRSRAVEMLVFIPPFDDESGRILLSAVMVFHQQRVKIVGFNGSRFLGSESQGG